MNAHRLAFAFTLLITCGIAPAASQTLLPPQSSWQYSFDAPSGGWQTGADGGVAWRTGNSPFSNCGPLGDHDCAAEGWPASFNANTRWPADESSSLDDDLWVRTQLDLSAHEVGKLQLQWALGADNGYKLYFNGVLLSQDNAESFTYRWEYSGTVPASLLNPTDNWIAVALEDHGGLTAFDMTVTAGDNGQPPIPEPQSAVLMLGGLAAILAMVRRKRSY